jgi:hypothetical protein
MNDHSHNIPGLGLPISPKTFNMVKKSILFLLALPLASAKMRGTTTTEAEEMFPKTRQLMGGMDGGGCPDQDVSQPVIPPRDLSFYFAIPHLLFSIPIIGRSCHSL